MKLTNKEKTDLKILISKFDDLHTRLDLECSKLDEIEEEKKLITESIEKLANDINEVRIEEKKILDKLHKKYGPFKFNLESFEIESIIK